MKQKVEVELIPWIHGIESLLHEDVITYVKSLPKNSVVALEGNEKFINEMTVNEFSNFSQKYFWGHFAFVELLNECKKRNISIIQLQTLAGELRDRKDSLKEKKRIDYFREKSFAHQIKSILKKFDKPTLYVIVGLSHIKQIQEELANLGIESSVQIQRLKYRSLRSKLLRMEKSLRSALKKNNIDKAMRIEDEIRHTIVFQKGTRKIIKPYLRMFSSILMRKVVQRKRIKRKAQKAKRKMAQRKKIA